jgi:hypothetical protein
VGEEIQRSYTPTSCDEDLGHFDLVVKIYKKGLTQFLFPRTREGNLPPHFLIRLLPGEKPQFPDGGKVSQYLDTLSIGQELEVSGPFGLIEYLGSGRFTGTLNPFLFEKFLFPPSHFCSSA